MGAFTALLGWTLVGPVGLAVGFVLIGGAALFARRGGARLELYIAGARPIAVEEAPGLYEILAWLCERAGVTTVPRLYLVPAPVPAALTLGSPGDASIALTPRLLAELTPRELTGVLAHELSHVVSRDTRLMAVGDLLHRVTRFFSSLGWLLLLLNVPLFLLGQATIPWATVGLLVVGPNLNALLVLALSRAREHEADAGAVELTGDPEGLASALVKVELGSRPWWYALLPGGRPRANPLLQTHPSTEARIRHIRERAQAPLGAPRFEPPASLEARPRPRLSPWLLGPPRL